jgi:hypothetical protein
MLEKDYSLFMKGESMKRIVMMAGTVMLMGIGIATAEVAQPENKAVDTAVVVKKQTLCPIMTNNPVNAKLFVDHDGKRIYVCCKGCIGDVKKDPAKYIAKLEKEGITLDKTPVAATEKSAAGANGCCKTADGAAKCCK